jgi:hypothetical protein
VATLSFASAGLTNATSAGFAVSTPPLQLYNLRSPANANEGVVFGVQPTVQVAISGGPIAYSSTAPVTASIASGTGTLAGTTTVNAVSGIVTYTDLRIIGSGPHTLRYSSPGVASATSESFFVTPAPLQYGLNVGNTTPVNAQAGQNITIPIGLDFSGAPGGDVGAITFSVTWDVTKFSFVSGALNGAAGFALIDNTTNAAAAGTLVVSGFAVPSVTTTRMLYTVVLTAKAAAANSSTAVNAAVTTGADGVGNHIAITPRNLTVIITP